MSLPAYTPSRIQELAQLYSGMTGLDASVAAAQIEAEQGWNGNVLGLTVANGSATHVYPGQTGVWQASNGQWLATFATQETGLTAAAWWLKNPSSPYAAVRNAIATGKAAVQAHALAASGWAGSGGYLRSSAFGPLLSNSPGPGTGTSSPTDTSASSSGSLASSLAAFLGISPSQPLTDALALQAAGKYAKTNAAGYGPAYQGAVNSIYSSLLKWLGKPAGQVPFNVTPAGGNTGQVVTPSPADQASGNTQRGGLIDLSGLPAAIAAAIAPIAVALVVIAIIAWLALSGVREVLPEPA